MPALLCNHTNIVCLIAGFRLMHDSAGGMAIDS